MNVYTTHSRGCSCPCTYYLLFDHLRVCLCACLFASFASLHQIWELVHRVGGYGAVVLSVAAIVTGLLVITPAASNGIIGVYLAWMALLLAIFCGLQVKKWCSASDDGAPTGNAAAHKPTPTAPPVDTATAPKRPSVTAVKARSTPAVPQGTTC